MTSTETVTPGGLATLGVQNSAQPADQPKNKRGDGDDSHLSNVHIFGQSPSPDVFARGLGVYPVGYKKGKLRPA